MNKPSFKLKSYVKLAKLQKHKFAEADSEKGKLFYDTLTVGSDVWMEDENGDVLLPEDGDYEIEGQMVTLVAGKITEIKPIELEEEKEEEKEKETEGKDITKEAKEVAEEVAKTAEIGFTDADTLQHLIELVDELVKEVNEQKTEMAKQKSELSKLTTKLSKSQSEPYNEKEINKNKKSDLSRFGL